MTKKHISNANKKIWANLELKVKGDSTKDNNRNWMMNVGNK
jgi:hypothetical protein